MRLEPVTSSAVVSDRVPPRQKIGYGLGSFLDMFGHWLYPSLAFQVFNIGLGVAPGLISTVLALKLLSGIPAIGLALALLVVFRFRLDGARMTEIRLALEGRRGQV